MLFLDILLVIAIIFTFSGIYIFIKKDFTFVPNRFYINLKESDKNDFIKNYGIGLCLTGICLIFAIVDFFNSYIIRWGLFGFTLAYSDIYLKKARRLNFYHKKNFKFKQLEFIKNNQKLTLKTKTYQVIVAGCMVLSISLGLYLVNSFYTLANNRPFEDFIQFDEVSSASIYVSTQNEFVELNATQIQSFADIFNNIVIYEEKKDNFINANAITYNINKNDGTVLEVKSIGNTLILYLNGDFSSYIINEDVSEQLNFWAFSII